MKKPAASAPAAKSSALAGEEPTIYIPFSEAVDWSFTRTRSFVERETPSRVSPLLSAVDIVMFAVVAATQLSFTSKP